MLNSKPKLLSIIALTFGLTFQSGESIGQHFYFHHLDQSKGLSNEFNAHFGQTPDGLFWTSSRDGLNLYDGKEVKVYRPEIDGKALDPNITSKVYSDTQGKHWFTSQNALHYLTLDNGALTSFQIKPDDNRYYYAFHLEKDSLLWVQVEDTLYQVDITQQPLQWEPLHTLGGFIAHLILNQDQEVVGVSRSFINGKGIEIIKYDQERKISQRDTFFYYEGTPHKDPCTFLYYYVESEHSFWLPTNRGLIHFDPFFPENYQLYKHDEALEIFNYKGITPWKENYLWIGDRTGIIRLFDTESGNFIDSLAYFNMEGTVHAAGTIDNLWMDPENTLWVSFSEYGLLFSNLDNTKFDQLLPLSFLNDHPALEILSITKHQDKYYLLIKGQGLIQMDEEKQIEPIRLGFTNGLLSKIFLDSQGDLWLVTPSEKIFIWNPTTQLLKATIQVSSNTFEVRELNDLQFLILSRNAAQVISKKQLPLSLTTGDAQELSNIRGAAQSFYAPKQGLIFIAQNSSLLVFEDVPPFKFVRSIQGIGYVNSIYAGKDLNSIWLATSIGLYKYDVLTKTTSSRILDKENLLDRSLTTVVEDNAGKVWLSSYQGILRYDPDNDKTDYFTNSDGLYTMQYEENVAMKDEKGRIFFAGNNGVTFFSPEKVQLNQHRPKINLQRILVENRPVSQDQFRDSINPVRLPYRSNQLLFQYTVLEYSDPAKNQFEAFLIKNKKDTVFLSEDTRVALAEIREGNYELHSRAFNSDGISSGKTEKVYFRISPPFQRSRVGFSLIIIGIILLFYGFYRWRIFVIKRDEAVKLKLAEFETAVLRLQMNPHFIFNSLNSIDSYINERDVNTASNYLTQFAKLMRKVLRLSKKPFISLGEEIEFLDLYLELESKRLAQPLNYEFHLPEDMDPDDILFPTMILQPFVENAIWHGVSEKNGPGKIDLEFEIEDTYLHCKIRDNGVGRQFHQEKKKEGPHQSQATDITNERLTLLRETTQKKASLNIIDLYDAQKAAAGTLVVLILPLID